VMYSSRIFDRFVFHLAGSPLLKVRRGSHWCHYCTFSSLWNESCDPRKQVKPLAVDAYLAVVRWLAGHEPYEEGLGPVDARRET
jgi:hypothetical protein